MGGIVSSGHGLQSNGDNLLDSFNCQKLLEGQNRMKGGDTTLIQGFVVFVKGGTWVGRFATFSAPSRVEHEEISVCGGWCACYGLLEDQLPNAFSELQLEMANTEPPTLRWDASKTSGCEPESNFEELYKTASHCTCFDRSQLACILFSVAYPVFLATKRSRYRTQSFSSFWHRSGDQASFPSGAPRPGWVQTAESFRAQELLLGCAAFYDEECLVSLAKEDWLSVVTRAVMEHPMAIGIIDTSQPYAHIQYVNTAFCAQFGYAPEELLGTPMSVLRGEGSEESQCHLLQKALHGSVRTKLWITHYTKNQQRVLDLVAVAPLGNLAVCVHFAASRRGADFNQLQVCILYKTIRLFSFPPLINAVPKLYAHSHLAQQVDDLLLLLGYLVHPPERTVSVRQVLASVRAAVLNLRATALFGTSRPSPNRSHSQSSSTPHTANSPKIAHSPDAKYRNNCASASAVDAGLPCVAGDVKIKGRVVRFHYKGQVTPAIEGEEISDEQDEESCGEPSMDFLLFSADGGAMKNT